MSQEANTPEQENAALQPTLGKRSRLSVSSPTLPEGRPPKRQKDADTKNDLASFPIDGVGKRALQSTDVDPWHLNDRFVRRFKQEELLAYIRGRQDVPPDADDCPIHPIFHQLGSLAAYMPCLVAALRLATRFLVSRHTLPFFHQLMTYNIDLLTPESQYFNRILTHIPSSPYADIGLPPAEHHLTLRGLIALAPHISIVFANDSKIKDKWAYTIRQQKIEYRGTSAGTDLPSSVLNGSNRTPAPSTNILAQLGFQGTNTLLNLSPHFLSVLHPDTQPSPSPPQRQRATFFLAVTLVHELAHAVYMLRFPTELRALLSPSQDYTSTNNPKLVSEEYEPFYSTQLIPELGHAWETSIFRSMPPFPSSKPPTYERGGIISSLANSTTFDIGLAWSRWPSSDSAFFIAHPLSHLQQTRKYPPIPLSRLTRHTRSGAIYPRPTPRWKTIYPIPDPWIARFFRKQFWDELNGDHPTNAPSPLSRFTPPRSFGVRCANHEWNIDGEYDSTAVGMGTEANWGLGDEGSSLDRGEDEQGVVRTGQRFRWAQWKDDIDDDHEEDEESDG